MHLERAGLSLSFTIPALDPNRFYFITTPVCFSRIRMEIEDNDSAPKDRPTSGKKEHVHFGLAESGENIDATRPGTSDDENGVLITQTSTFYHIFVLYINDRK